jgi:ABC-type antimicrobial peptide transport system permease subunit
MVATWALVFAASIAVFSLISGIMLTPVIAANADRLVAISTTDSRTNQPGTIHFEAFRIFRARQHSFSALSMYSVRFLRAEVRGTGIDVNVEGINPEYFEAVGARPAIGRFFSDDDTELPPSAVITNALWQRLFGGDAQILGETVKLDGHPVTIIGVAAPEFSGLQFDGGSDLMLPLSFVRSLAGDRKGGVACGQYHWTTGARRDVGERARRGAREMATLPAAEQTALKSQRVVVESAANGFSTLRREYGPSLLIVMGLSAILLVIALVNLSGMLLARAMARQHETAVLLALGAGRARVFLQSSTRSSSRCAVWRLRCHWRGSRARA